MNRPLALLLLFCVVSVAGCKTYEPALLFGGQGLRDEAVLIVPFREPRQHRWYGESARGEYVAESIKYWVAKTWSGMLLDTDVADDIVDEVRDWPEEHVGLKDWQKLCEGSGIDYVVVGDLTEVRLKSTQRIGLLDAYVSARYRVIDAQRGREVFVRKKVEVTLGGRTDAIDVPILDMSVDEKAVEKRLLVTLAKMIGRELYGEYTD